jgi:hypothetical protein
MLMMVIVKGDNSIARLLGGDESNCHHIAWDGWKLYIVLNEHGEPLSLHDQNFIHNGKNPLNNHVRLSQLGANICCLEHLELVCIKFMFDEYGRKLEDIWCIDK